MAKITVMNTDITVINYSDHDYISLTDMATDRYGKCQRGRQPCRRYYQELDAQQIYH